MMTCDWKREDWIERMVCALIPLVETVTAAPYGAEPLSNGQYRTLAEQAKFDKHAKIYFDYLFPKLNEEPNDLINLLCQHPIINCNIGGTGNDLATFIVMPPSSGFRFELSLQACLLTKSALQRGCLGAVGHLDHFLSLSSRGKVFGYEITVFRGLSMSGGMEIAPGLEILDYRCATERGLVRNGPPDPANIMPDYADMGALVLARQMTWGPCLVPPLTIKNESPKLTPEFRWGSGCNTGIVFDFLSICASHKVELLWISHCAPEFADVHPCLVSGSGYSFTHGEHWSKQNLTEEHIYQLQKLLLLWSQFTTDRHEILELAVSRLSSAMGRKQGRFWVQDRILDVAIALEIMYELEPPELTNKLATRAAHLLAEEVDKRIEIFDRVHVFYDARSKITHGNMGRRQEKRKKAAIDFKEISDSGFALASETLRALLDNGEFPKWKKLIMSGHT